MASDPIILALTEQVECYRRLAKLAEVQHEHVRQSETEALLEVLARRQEVLDRITALEITMSSAKNRWTEYFGDLLPTDRAGAQEMLDERKRLLQQITDADRDDALILQQRKLNLGKQINQAGAARQVNRNYAAAAYGAKPARMDIQR